MNCFPWTHTNSPSRKHGGQSGHNELHRHKAHKQHTGHQELSKVMLAHNIIIILENTALYCRIHITIVLINARTVAPYTCTT